LPRPRIVVWTAEQVGEFLDFVEDERLHPLLRLVLMTGLRRGEAVGLGWSDVDLDEKVLTVRQQVVDVRGELHIGPPKTKSGERVVPFDDETAAVLRAQKRAQGAERLARFGTRVHQLRHTSASLALSADVAMKVVSVRLGHSSTGFTADWYTHVVPASAREAADKIADAVSLAARARQAADTTPISDVSAM